MKVNLDEMFWFSVALNYTELDTEDFRTRVMWINDAIGRGFVVSGEHFFTYEGSPYLLVTLVRYKNDTVKTVH